MPLLPLREILPDIRRGADVGRVCSLIICNNRPLNRCKPNRSTRINTHIYAQTMKGERSESVDGEGFDEFAQSIRHSEFLKKAILLPVLTLATRLRGLLLRRSFPSRERPHAVRKRSSTICGETFTEAHLPAILDQHHENPEQCRPHDPRPPPLPPLTWHTSDVALLPFPGWVFLSRNVSRVLYWLQLLAAPSCVSLSLMRLVEQNFGELRPDDPGKKNRKAALNIFYSLALAEALLFLAEKAYWEWKVTYSLLLEEVNRECHLGATGMLFIKRFFYDAYSKCVEGSIFDGLKMDLVTFGEELLGSSSRDEHLTGARVLLKFSTNHRFADGTLRKIGTSTPVIEMLNWKTPAEEEIRRSAEVIVSKLARKKQNALRVAGIPGATESISSYTGRSNSNSRPDEVSRQCAGADYHADHEFSNCNLLGLLILKKLAKDHDKCGKIGNTRGLLATIIDFTGGGERLGRRESATESQVKAVKRSAVDLLQERIDAAAEHGVGRSRGDARYAGIGEQEQLLQDSEGDECRGKAG
ncbi:hypothetical protein C4D60_Mb08t06890 [Musa balbisiana]|uniref:Uncharacterized protein n=1 Tax=Musa balbisiana TaxID=52838 RepID=A0A4S8K1X0_MUSBA|nr:hypothetical protein C4D60_Mb08t06890 [Musa balbisiana]